MAARRRAGSFSPKTSRRLRISKVDMLYGMACLLSASSAACDISTRNGSFVCLKLRYEVAFHILRWLTTIFVASADGRLDGRDKRRAVTALMKARIISAGDLESHPGRTNRVRITGNSSPILQKEGLQTDRAYSHTSLYAEFIFPSRAGKR